MQSFNLYFYRVNYIELNLEITPTEMYTDMITYHLSEAGFEMFEEMIGNIQKDAVKIILKSRIDTKQAPQRKKVAEPLSTNLDGNAAQGRKPVVSAVKVGRNDPCPCGSGKKYKKCCGAKAH